MYKGGDAMPIIRPITDLRNTNEISELCHTRQEPVFITKNGYGDLVVMSMATYERQTALLEAYQKLDEAEEQAASGVPNIDGDEVFARLRKKYGQPGV
jgi:PHD/YefM family antitoxin component YafN of YafNO toxin-antitoxin module